MPAQNQQYYEFQWRVLNLCSEFYGAAEELIVCESSLKSLLCVLTPHLEGNTSRHYTADIPTWPRGQGQSDGNAERGSTRLR